MRPLRPPPKRPPPPPSSSTPIKDKTLRRRVGEQRCPEGTPVDNYTLLYTSGCSDPARAPRGILGRLRSAGWPVPGWVGAEPFELPERIPEVPLELGVAPARDTSVTAGHVCRGGAARARGRTRQTARSEHLGF